MIILTTPEATAAVDSLLTAIQGYTGQTASHTAYNFWSDGVCLIGIVSLFCTVFSFAAKETLGPKTYRAMLYDLIRHLYRNRICTLAIWAKYKQAEKLHEKLYPSDEHYLKMLIPDKSLHNSYNFCSKRWEAINKLEIQFRNYNIEVEVALNHIKDDSIDDKTKMRDFQTLYFKTGFLSEQITELMIPKKKWWQFRYKSRIRKIRDDAFNKIKENHENNVKEYTKEQLSDSVYKSELDEIYKSYEGKKDKFESIFNDDTQREKFRKYLREDVVVECGNNSSGGEKIHMIKKIQKD
jgi:hypothetical protein